MYRLYNGKDIQLHTYCDLLWRLSSLSFDKFRYTLELFAEPNNIDGGFVPTMDRCFSSQLHLEQMTRQLLGNRLECSAKMVQESFHVGDAFRRKSGFDLDLPDVVDLDQENDIVASTIDVKNVDIMFGVRRR
jgi:hypothetical protein